MRPRWAGHQPNSNELADTPPVVKPESHARLQMPARSSRYGKSSNGHLAHLFNRYLSQTITVAAKLSCEVQYSFVVAASCPHDGQLDIELPACCSMQLLFTMLPVKALLLSCTGSQMMLMKAQSLIPAQPHCSPSLTFQFYEHRRG